jgi:hypothetical protein
MTRAAVGERRRVSERVGGEAVAASGVAESIAGLCLLSVQRSGMFICNHLLPPCFPGR